MRRTSLLVIAALGLVVVAQAGAHTELTPKTVPAGGFSTFVLAVLLGSGIPLWRRRN